MATIDDVFNLNAVNTTTLDRIEAEIKNLRSLLADKSATSAPGPFFKSTITEAIKGTEMSPPARVISALSWYPDL